MGKGKPGNLTAHLFRHDIRVPEVEANPNARVYQLVHGLLNGAEAARNGWTRLIIGQRERIIAISEEGEEMPVRVGRTWSTAQRLMPSLQKLLTESRAAPQMLMKFGIQ